MVNSNCTPIASKNKRAQAKKTIYTVDWQYLAEQADLEARRWQLTAELARINQALESYQGVENGQ
jgi:hypothetical protein